MNDQPMQYKGNPLHDMEDEELVSRMILAREEGKNIAFSDFRRELMYRLRCSHIENWTPPARFPTGKVGVAGQLAPSKRAEDV